MKPEDFIKWLEGRINETHVQKQNLSFENDPCHYTAKGGKLTVYKEVLDFYRKHAVTHQFH
jgi:hypothetical protein